MPDGAALAWIDGHVLPLGQARIPIADRGHLLGDGVFETLRTVAGKPFGWDLHAARLHHGLTVLGIGTEAVEVAAHALEALTEAAKGPGERYLRVQVSRTATVREPDDAPGVVTAISRPLVAYPDRVYADGVRLAVAPWRKDAADPLATVKHLSYLPYLVARRHARAAGADDALILNAAGRPCEASHSNLLVRLGDILHAPGPAEGALDGVTRRLLLDRLPDGLRVEERLPMEAFAHADEVLLTNTVGGVVPVASVRGPVAPRLEGHQGRLYRTLRKIHDELVGPTP